MLWPKVGFHFLRSIRQSKQMNCWVAWDGVWQKKKWICWTMQPLCANYRNLMWLASFKKLLLVFFHSRLWCWFGKKPMQIQVNFVLARTVWILGNVHQPATSRCALLGLDKKYFGFLCTHFNSMSVSLGQACIVLFPYGASFLSEQAISNWYSYEQGPSRSLSTLLSDWGGVMVNQVVSTTRAN